MILKYFQKFFAVMLVTLIISVPFFSQAIDVPGLNEAVNSVNNSGDSTTIKNPLKVDNVTGLVNSLINVAISIGIPLATLALVWAGYLYVSAAGNTTQISAAHKILQDILWGIVIILGAKAILASIQATIKSL